MEHKFYDESIKIYDNENSSPFRQENMVFICFTNLLINVITLCNYKQIKRCKN